MMDNMDSMFMYFGKRLSLGFFGAEISLICGISSHLTVRLVRTGLTQQDLSVPYSMGLPSVLHHAPFVSNCPYCGFALTAALLMLSRVHITFLQELEPGPSAHP